MNSRNWMAPKLKHRIKICEATQTPNDNGGFDLSYTTIIRVWAGIKEMSDYSKYIRGVQINNETETHEFLIRLSSVQNIGKAFSKAFSVAFNSIGDFNPVKSNYYILTDEGSSPIKGRLFRIRSCKRDDNFKTFIKIRCNEIEEQGTGAPV